MIARPSSPMQGHLAMLSFSLLVSLSFTLGHIVAKDISPAVLSAVRFLIGGVLLLAAALVLGRDLKPVFTRFWRWLVIGGLMAIYFIAMFEALRLTTPVSTSAIFTLTPLMAAGFGLVLARERIGPWTLLALTIGGLGAVWVIFRADWARLITFELGTGEVIYFFGAAAHAAVPGLTRRIAGDTAPVQVAFGSVIGALIVTGLYSLPDLADTDFAALPAAVWWVALYLGVFATGCTFFLIQFAIPRLKPGNIMAYTYLVPSWVVLYEFIVNMKRQPTPLFARIAATLVALLMLLRTDRA